MDVYVVIRTDCNGYTCQTWVPTEIASQEDKINSVGTMKVETSVGKITLDRDSDPSIMPYAGLVGCLYNGHRVRIIATY